MTVSNVIVKHYKRERATATGKDRQVLIGDWAFESYSGEGATNRNWLGEGLFDIQTHDDRIHFEASSHCFYVPMDLAEKVLNYRYLLENWLPAQ